MKWILKVLDFIADNPLTNWLGKDARAWHLLGGTAIFVLMLIAGVMVNAVMPVDVWANVALAHVATFLTLFGVEVHGQVSYGSKFDWNDILAGELLPVAFTIGIAISILI